MRKGFFIKLALSNIRKNRKVYYPYLLTSVITTAMLYIITALSLNVSLDSATLLFCLQLGVVVTTLFSIVFLFYTNSFLMKRRKKEFGLFNILGMEKKHIGRMVVWETVVILLVSLVGGFAIGVLLDKLLFMALGRMMNLPAMPQFVVSPTAMGAVAIIIGATYVLILLNSLRQIHVAKPVELLRGGEVGEKEPKARWLLALVGLLTLGAGYYLSVSVQDVVWAIMVFFLAVLLVIAGTYLLFTAGSITMLKMLKKNKRYYYQTEHFISLSGLMYRMKRNAVGLANICLLSTMVLVMVFSTVTLWMSIEDSLSTHIASDVSVETFCVDRTQEAVDFVRESAEKAGVEVEREQHYRYLSFAGVQRGDEISTDRGDPSLDVAMADVKMLMFMPLTEYNAAFHENAQLAAGEVLISTNRGEYERDKLELLGYTFTVKERVHQQWNNASFNNGMYTTHFIIVPDEATFEAIAKAQEAVYGEHASHIQLLINAFVSGTDEQQLAMQEALRELLAEAQFDHYTTNSRVRFRQELVELYGGLLFVGLFLSALFIMAMILIMYYKQISEGYDDNERYRIMRKVGLSRNEIKRSINSQIMLVFFLPLLVAGIHVVFAFPCITVMFSMFSMVNVPLMALCALGSFALFGVLYGLVYLLTSRVYYRIVSQ